MKQPKLVTLTLRKTGGLVAITRKISSYARRFRFYMARRGIRVRRFVWVVEPPNHVHGVYDMDYMPQWELAEMWHLITGDSFIVDIRRVDEQRVGGYLTKYLAKASGWSNFNLDAVYGVHICGSWNTGLGQPILMICDSCDSRFWKVESHDLMGLYSDEIVYLA